MAMGLATVICENKNQMRVKHLKINKLKQVNLFSLLQPVDPPCLNSIIKLA